MGLASFNRARREAEEKKNSQPIEEEDIEVAEDIEVSEDLESEETPKEDIEAETPKEKEKKDKPIKDK